MDLDILSIEVNKTAVTSLFFGGHQSNQLNQFHNMAPNRQLDKTLVVKAHL
jgi:hypothetical protein